MVSKINFVINKYFCYDNISCGFSKSKERCELVIHIKGKNIFIINSVLNVSSYAESVFGTKGKFCFKKKRVKGFNKNFHLKYIFSGVIFYFSKKPIYSFIDRFIYLTLPLKKELLCLPKQHRTNFIFYEGVSFTGVSTEKKNFSKDFYPSLLFNFNINKSIPGSILFLYQSIKIPVKK